MNRKALFFLAVALVGIVASGIIRRVISQSSPPCTAEFVTRLQGGIASQAPPPTTLQAISPAISNAVFFMQYRSGLSVSSTVQQRLAKLEQEVWPGNCNGVCKLTRQEVKNIITATLMDGIRGLTDAQINAISTGSFCVLPGWTPSNRMMYVDLKSSAMNVDQATFVQNAKLLRNGDSTLQSLFTSAISNEVDACCNTLAYALPSQWNTTYYDPYQVFFIAYSLISEDHLADSYSDYKTHMSNMANWLAQQGFNCPYEGRCKWGDVGYMYSRPVSTLFSDTQQMNLLNRYAAIHGLS